MTRASAFLVLCIVALGVLVSAGPTVVGLTQAAVPLVLALGAVAIVLRLVWHYTNRY